MPRQRTSRTGAAQNAESSPATFSDEVNDQARGDSMVDETREKVHDLANQAQEKASQQLQAGVSRGKNRAAEALGSVAQSLVYSSQQLREQDRGTLGGYVEKAANRVERLADYVQNTNASEMVDRAEGFARREPALFLGGAFAIGLLGARFLKSSRKGEQPAGVPYGASRGPGGGQSSRPGGVMSDREVPISRAPYDSEVLGAGMPGASTPRVTRQGEFVPGSTTDETGGREFPLGTE